MSIFTSTLSQMVFLIIMIAIGFIIAKIKAIPQNSASVLAKLENNVFIPCLVMGTFINNFTVERLGETWKLFAFSFIIMIVIVPLSIFIPKLVTKDGFARNIYTYGLAFSNFGFMGNSVVKALFPELFWQYLIFTLPLWILIYLWGVPALLMPSNEERGGIAGRLKNLLNPMFIAMLVGMVIGICDIPLYSGVSNVITTLGDCMSPVAMLLTGITVASISFKKVFTNVSIYAVSIIRLIVIPVVFIAVLTSLPLSDDFIICAVCSLSMPLGLNTIVIPSAYGKDPTVASGMALISHLLSCITIPIIFFVLMRLL